MPTSSQARTSNVPQSEDIATNIAPVHEYKPQVAVPGPSSGRHIVNDSVDMYSADPGQVGVEIAIVHDVESLGTSIEEVSVNCLIKSPLIDATDFLHINFCPDSDARSPQQHATPQNLPFPPPSPRKAVPVDVSAPVHVQPSTCSTPIKPGFLDQLKEAFQNKNQERWHIMAEIDGLSSTIMEYFR